jgi:hypothetical protein
LMFLCEKANEEVFSWHKSACAVLITKCPIYNLFAKKVLMLYNKVGLERRNDIA